MRALLVLLLIGACHHDPAPAEPSDKPPLPPASGTPIGFLIDDAGELKLSDTQVAKLRDLDTSLAADLESIDAQTRQASKPAEESSAAPPSGGGGRHHRGGGGGMGGGGGGRHHRNGGGSGSGAPSPSGAAIANKLSDRRSADVKDALERAFAVLDPGQQAAAKKVLADHDVDVDVNAAPPQLPAPANDEADPPPEP